MIPIERIESDAEKLQWLHELINKDTEHYFREYTTAGADRYISNAVQAVKESEPHTWETLEHLYEIVNLVSFESLVKCRHYTNLLGGTTMDQFGYIFHDPELSALVNAGYLVLSEHDVERDIVAAAKELLRLVERKRELTINLVNMLLTSKKGEAVKGLQKRLKTCRLQTQTSAKAFSDFSEQFIAVATGPRSSRSYGIGCYLFGWDGHEKDRSELEAWKRTLSERKLAKLRSTFDEKRSCWGGIALKDPAMVDLLFLERNLPPIFAHNREAGVEKGHLYSYCKDLYDCLHLRWVHMNGKFENHFMGNCLPWDAGIRHSYLHKVATGRNLNVVVPPRFTTPREMTYELICGDLCLSYPNVFKSIVESVGGSVYWMPKRPRMGIVNLQIGGAAFR